MAGEEKQPSPRAAVGLPQLPRASLRPQSPGTPRHGGTALPPVLQPSSLPGSGHPPGARVQWGVQPQGMLEQPEGPPGSGLGSRSQLCACPCQCRGQRCTAGLPSLPLPQFPQLSSPARALGEPWCPESNASKESNGVHVPSGRGAVPRHTRQLSVQMLPRRSCAHFPFWQKASQPEQVHGAWQHRGAAGASLADGCKMTQWEPKSGWHPVFNQAAGGSRGAPW